MSIPKIVGIEQEYAIKIANAADLSAFHASCALVNAYAMYISRTKDDVDLVLAGRITDVTYYERLCRQIKELNLENRVHFPGFVPNDRLPPLYAHARCFVYPSRAEAQPNPPIEAMACGAPMVCSNTTSIPEICGDAALYFQPEDTEELADKIQQVMQNPKLRESLVALGGERVKMFSWERGVKVILQMLQESADKQKKSTFQKARR